MPVMFRERPRQRFGDGFSLVQRLLSRSIAEGEGRSGLDSSRQFSEQRSAVTSIRAAVLACER